MKSRTRLEILGGSAGALVAIIVLCGYFHPILGAVGIATTESVDAVVDTKIAAAINGLQGRLEDYRRDDTEMWINYLDSKANHQEADESDMVLLEAKKRQREELLTK